MLVCLPNPQNIRETTVRGTILAIRAKSSSNRGDAIKLLNALRSRLLAIPAVRALPDPVDTLPLNVRWIIAESSSEGFTALEDDVMNLIGRAEAADIPIGITDTWEKAAGDL